MQSANDWTKEKGAEIYASQCENYLKLCKKSSADVEWFKSVTTSGTLSDKASALSIAIQEGPFYSLGHLHLLMAMAKKQNRREAILAVETLRDCFCQHLIPPTRKLKYFDQQQPALTKKLLVCRYFEDAVKTTYLQYLSLLEALLTDQLEFIRIKVLAIVWDLLIKAPEQEQSLLSLLINKLGDKENKVSSKASFLLLLTSQQHPNMILVLVREVKNAVEHAGQSSRFLYYALIFLNQIILTSKAVDVANMLVAIYFDIFKKSCMEAPKKEPVPIPKANNKKAIIKKVIVKKAIAKKAIIKKAIEEAAERTVDAEKQKLTSALLTGINRAFPFSKLPSNVLGDYVDSLFKMVHSSNFNTTIQALTLLFSMCTADSTLNTRFYRSLYEIFLESEKIAQTSKQPLFINLIYKALSADSNVSRIIAMLKRMLVCCAYQSPAFICASLIMLAELLRSHRALRGLKINSKQETALRHDAKKLDPQFSEAHISTISKNLAILAVHYHPSVSMYAKAIASGEHLSVLRNAASDPFESFTAICFLDKFVYKNPKKEASSLVEGGLATAKQRGISAMQPIKFAATKEPLQSINKRFSQPGLKPDNVQADEIFFFNFFQSSANQASSKSSKKEKEVDEKEIEDLLANEVENMKDAGKDEDDEDDDEDEELEHDNSEQSPDDSEQSQDDPQQPQYEVEQSPDEMQREEPSRKKSKKTKLPLFADASQYLSD